MSEERVQIIFPLEVDDESWPPVSAERMWAKRTHEGTYEIDNTPLFVEAIALGDIVTARRPREGSVLQYENTIKYSGNLSLSIIVLDETAEPTITDFLSAHDVWFEKGGPGTMTMIAVSVPSLIRYAPIKKFLLDLEEKAQLSLAELCLPD